MLTHTDRLLECAKCQQFFASYHELRNHELFRCGGDSQQQGKVEVQVVTTTIEIEKEVSLLDLTKKDAENNQEDEEIIVEVENESVPKKKLGFSIEDIMKR